MSKNKTTTGLGFEETLWLAADKLRGNLESSEYKHVVLGLIFLKYISDSFVLRQKEIIDSSDYVDGDEEDEDAYRMKNVFRVPEQARRSYLQSNARKPEIGQLIDQAMMLIEKENPKLKGVLTKDYARPSIDKVKLGELIDILSDKKLQLAQDQHSEKDILGRVYEYFLAKFAGSEGKGGGEFYTPPCIVKLNVEMIEPYKGRIYEPCIGSGGMVVQSAKFLEAHGGNIDDISVYGQEYTYTTRRLCQMNLAIRGISANLGTHQADSFTEDLHKDLKADFIMANPPFNISDWGGERLKDDVRWKYGIPPTGNANYAWIQHMIHHLAPNGVAGFVMANGSLSSNQSGEGEIRKNIIEADLVDCIVALPSQLFYSTMIPACLRYLRRGKQKRNKEILFIDARKMGQMITRKNRELSDDEISKISKTYHNRRTGETEYEDIKGFCKSVNLEEIAKHEYVLTPGRYVGTELVEEDEESFDQKMKELTAQLAQQMEKGHELDEKIKENLAKIGYPLYNI